MIGRIIATLLVLVICVPPARGAPRKVMVLPLDGTAPPDARKKLSASVQKMARVLDGDVMAGNASFVDTATALGCDPAKPACAEQVRAALDVNEIVYGTADQNGETITVLVKRYRKGKESRELAVSQPASEPASKIEPAVLPVFGTEPLPGESTTTPAGSGTGDGAATITGPEAGGGTVTGDPASGVEAPPGSNRVRNIWIGVTAGGAVVTLLGVAFWFQAQSLQDDIDNHSTSSAAAIEDLKELEDKASSRAWAGNIAVLLGLGIAGYGGYRLWKWKQTKEVTVTPAAVDGGAAITLGGRW